MHILLIDDHGILRAGVCSLIQQVHPGARIYQASCRQQALEQLRAQVFDVIFLDLCIPTTESSDDVSADNGFALLSALKGERDSTDEGPAGGRVCAPVIVMSAQSERRFIDEVMKRGASSFVPKSASHEVMLDAINRALQGGVYLPHAMIGKGGCAPLPETGRFDQSGVTPISAADLGVTAREFDVLRLALQGNAPWKIALMLEINAVNVRHYLSRLYAKFGVIDLYGLQGLFARTGQVLGVLSCPASRALA